LGPDDFSRRRSLDDIKQDLGDPVLLATNTTVLDGQQLTADQLAAAGQSLPFMAEKRLVIVNGLLTRFNPSSGARQRGKGRRTSQKSGQHQSFMEVLDNLPDTTIMVLIDDEAKSSNPLFHELSPQAEVRSFPPLRGSRLRQWIQQQVTAAGGSISPPAVDLMAQLVGGDLWAMSNEIDKLVAFATGQRIEETDISRVLSYHQQANVFAMVDAILHFKAGDAEIALSELLQGGAAPAYLLYMLWRQVQLITRAKELKSQGIKKKDIQDRLRITSDFALQKTLDQASRYPRRRLIELYQKLLEADLAIKTGRYESSLALNILIADLCQPLTT